MFGRSEKEVGQNSCGGFPVPYDEDSEDPLSLYDKNVMID